MKKEIVARLGALGALACVAGAGYLFLQHSGRDKVGPGGDQRTGRHPGDHGGGRTEGRPALRARHRHGAGLQHGRHQDARRRRDRQGGLPGRPGREGGRSAVPDRPAPLPGRPRRSHRDPDPQPGAARRRRARPQPLHPDGEPGLPVDPAARPAAVQGRRAQGLDRGRRGGHAHRTAQPRLCQHPRAVRRPHRHPPGRHRQSRAGLAGHQPGQHQPDQADLRQFHRAAGRQRRRPAQPGAGRAHRRRLRQQRRRAGARHAVGDRQPDRHDDRHAPPQGHLRQRRRASVAGTIRQCAPGAVDAVGHGDRAAARRHAGRQRLFLLRRQGRRHGRAADDRARRRPGRRGRHHERRHRRRKRRDRRPVPPDRRGAGAGSRRRRCRRRSPRRRRPRAEPAP